MIWRSGAYLLVFADDHWRSQVCTTGINRNVLPRAEEQLWEGPHPFAPFPDEVVGPHSMHGSLTLWLTYSNYHGMRATEGVRDAVYL